MDDPLALAHALGKQQKAELLTRCGRPLSAAQVAHLLGMEIRAVEKQRLQGKLIAVPSGDDFVYPAVQFDGPRLIAGLPEVLAELHSSSWVAFSFLVDASEQLNGHSVLEVLKSGSLEQRSVVLRMARIHAGDGYG